MRISDEQIAEWRTLQGEGLTSAVGEYTPGEFWELLDAYEALRSPQPAGVRVTDAEKYRAIHDAATQAYEAATPPDYRYSAIALRKAVDAAIAALEPQQEEAAGWMVERPLRDGGTHLYLPFLRTREEMQRYVEANPHETLVALYRGAPVQKVQESQTVSEDAQRTIAKALHESMVHQDVTGYLDSKIDASELARVALAALEPSHV